ncbi:MAG: hypothetical protein E7559_08785 [Ruminococcaceae bacterium]|nr:hypothetical protein [Oscillospiraceae bacterium]
MLSLLDIHEPPRRKAPAALWRRWFRPPVKGFLEWCAGQPYMRVCCEQHARGIDWRMVAAHSLEPSCRLLMPADIECPAESGLRRFTPTRYIRRMFERLALNILISSPLPPAQRRLAMYGRESEIALLLPHLVPLVGELRIITRRPETLSDLTEELSRRSGMPIVLTRDLSAGGCPMVLAPSGGAAAISQEGVTLCLSPDRPVGFGGLWVGSFAPTLPPALEGIYTPAYDLLEFCGAFYELSGIGMMATPRAGISGGAQYTPEMLGEMLVGQ